MKKLSAKYIRAWVEPAILITIIAAFIAGVTWVNNVNGAVEQVTGVKGDVHRIERKIDFMMGRMGFKYRDTQ